MEPGTDIQGRRVVIVLDDFVVAQALCGLIEDAGQGHRPHRLAGRSARVRQVQ